MAKEIERKFLVKDEMWRAQAGPGVTICQFYLVGAPDRSVRVRIRDDADALVTLKFGGQTRIRDEFEYEIPLEDAREMQKFAIGTIIEKTRYKIDHGGLIFEVDLFERDLTGLVIAELETPDEVGDDALPPWLGREITDQPAFYNVSLALNGMPEEIR